MVGRGADARLVLDVPAIALPVYAGRVRSEELSEGFRYTPGARFEHLYRDAGQSPASSVSARFVGERSRTARGHAAGGRGESISTRDCRSSSEQLRRLFSLARSTCGAVQNILSLLFLVLRSVSCRRYLPCHGRGRPMLLDVSGSEQRFHPGDLASTSPGWLPIHREGSTEQRWRVMLIAMTIGLIGAGHIGSQIARLAVANNFAGAPADVEGCKGVQPYLRRCAHHRRATSRHEDRRALVTACVGRRQRIRPAHPPAGIGTSESRPGRTASRRRGTQ